MATKEEDTETKTDIFQQQKKTIDTLIEVLDRQGSSQGETVYVQPAPAETKPPPNYLLYIGIAGVILLLLKK